MTITGLSLETIFNVDMYDMSTVLIENKPTCMLLDL